MNHSIDYMHDPQGRPRFYGLYRGEVISVNDPLKKNRIQVNVQMTTGAGVTAWAEACVPVTDNSYHPDHMAHTAAQVAALLLNHTDVITTSSVSDGGTGASAHSHTVTLNAAHRPATGQLNHPHVNPVHTMVTASKTGTSTAASPTTVTDTQETSVYAHGQTAPDGTNKPEHTFHRALPAVKQHVWIMFEAGDPEYPVWIGTQII
jgi:hypothetical protein